MTQMDNNDNNLCTKLRFLTWKSIMSKMMHTIEGIGDTKTKSQFFKRSQVYNLKFF